jgi:acetyl-CoA carboxylase biotin carboxyl carrier protein
MRLTPAGDLSGEGAFVPDSTEVEDGIPEGAIAVKAPTDGLFYDSPSPDEPPFVQEGQTIKDGQVVGLLEVMKFFYEIKYEAQSSQSARVLKVKATNSAPMSTGDVVVWVEPC